MTAPNKEQFDRRDFIKASALISAALFVRPARAEAKPITGRKVVVIGAGIAGLAAASELKAGGYEAIVLEARNRVGGRIWTDRSLGTPIDMAASWIEGARRNPITRLAKRFKARMKKTNYNAEMLFDFDGQEIGRRAYRRLEAGLDELVEGVEDLAEQSQRDLSVGEAVEQVLAGETLSAQERRFVDWAKTALEVEMAGDVSDLSLFNLDEDEAFPGPDLLVHGGFDIIPEGMARELDVRLNHRVQEVSHGKGGVQVTTDHGVLSADAAIVTLPLGILKARKVRFSPGLPTDKLQAIDRIGMGVANKVALRFPRVFWPERPHFFSYASNTRGEFPEFLNLHRYTKEPVLVAAMGGDYAKALENRSDSDIQAQAMGVLRKLFGSAIPNATGIKVGRSFKYAGGAYSFVRVGGSFDDYDTLAEPVENRLFFAGEATHRQYPATVHGAYLSGVREARRIMGEVTEDRPLGLRPGRWSRSARRRWAFR